MNMYRRILKENPSSSLTGSDSIFLRGYKYVAGSDANVLQLFSSAVAPLHSVLVEELFEETCFGYDHLFAPATEARTGALKSLATNCDCDRTAVGGEGEA